MHAIDTPGSIDGRFSDGNPSQGVDGTILGGEWLNDVQDDLLQLYAAAGIPAVRGTALMAPVIFQLIAFSFDEAIVPRLTVIAPYDVAPGQGVRVENAVGVALSSANTGGPLLIQVTGTLTAPLEPGVTVSVGSRLYWDDANRRVTPQRLSGFLYAGLSLTAASGSQSAAQVRLSGHGEEPVP